MDATTDPWLDGELAGCAFADERSGRRLRKLLERLAGAMGESLPPACQDWASTKAAYRFFANERVSERRRSSPATSDRHAGGSPRPAASSWSSRTPPSSPSSGSAPSGSASPAA